MYSTEKDLMNSNEKDLSEKSETDHIKNLIEQKITYHPAKRFLWSSALGDPFITWFFHRKALKAAPKSFFWRMTIVYLLLFIPYFTIECLIDYYSTQTNPPPFWVIYSLYGIFGIVVQGFLGAKIMKKTAPNYNSLIYKNNERCAIWFLVAIFIGYVIAIAEASPHEISLPITIFDLPVFFKSIFWKVI